MMQNPTVPRPTVSRFLRHIILPMFAVLTYAQAEPPVTKGLVLHLDGESGVQVSKGAVTRWEDQSGRKNDLFGHGDVELKKAATPAGRDALGFDGSNAWLDRRKKDHKISALPAKNGDRTVLLVARYHDTRWWTGFAYGNGDQNQTFGLVVNPRNNNLAVQGWGSRNDATSGTTGIGAGWLLQSAVLEGGQLSLFKDSNKILSERQNYNTVPDRIVIGEEIAGLGAGALDVAAVLVYDRALNPTELKSVESYLTQRYLVGSSKNAAPSVKIEIPENDSKSKVGETVKFRGLAKDKEDGDISEAIEWKSSRDGKLGNGKWLTARKLSEGKHTITASVVDSRDAADSTDITHTVGSAGGGGKPDDKPDDKPNDDGKDEDREDEVKEPGGKIVKLFDGKKFNGLYVWSADHGRGDPTNIFTIKNGMIRVAGDEQYAALMSEKEYSNYIMTLEFKWGEKTYGHRKGRARDAGILLHSQGGHKDWKGKLMPNIEVQVMEGGMGALMLLKGKAPMRMTAACTQGKCENKSWYCRGEYRWDKSASRRTFTDNVSTVHWYGWDGKWRDVAGFRGKNDLCKPHGEWNRFVIVCDEDRIEVYYNGVKVNEAFNVSPSRGRVQLEAEQAEYFVRKWELELLD